MTLPSSPIGHHKVSCTSCFLPDLCLRSGLSSQHVERLDHLVYTRLTVTRGEDLYRPGDPFSATYAIRSGFFKNDLTLEDGRNLVLGFHMPGEVIGMDRIGAGAYMCNAVALEDSEVCAIPLSRLEEISHEMSDFAHRLHQLMSEEIVRDRHVMVLLGGKTAEARLAAFLVNISSRLAARGCASSEPPRV